MEILINELSLTGQFKDENEFLNNFDSILRIINFIDKLNFYLLKEFNFFQVYVTHTLKLNDFLKLRTDRARKMKQLLLKLAYNPPYWNETQQHNCSTNSYTHNSSDICNTSLAESCERDRVVLSFKHDNFSNENLEIQKNSTSINIYNLINKDNFLEYLLSISKIEPIQYCLFKFKNSNLDFSLIQHRYGFDSLHTPQQINEFIQGLNYFSKMNWSNILKSGANRKGLNYKEYNGDWFKKTAYAHNKIFKFRITQKYRCFGYRKDDTFFVLRFEIDHKISNNG